MAAPDTIDLDYIIVADAAQVVGGKLFVLGGGWDRLFVPELPGRPALPFAVAVGIVVPWSMTNRQFDFALELADADGGVVDDLVKGEFEVGRPPGLRAGAPQRFQIAGPAGPEFPDEGRYVVQCRVDGELLGHTAIEVSATPLQQPQGI
jgi:nitrogen fixation protein